VTHRAHAGRLKVLRPHVEGRRQAQLSDEHRTKDELIRAQRGAAKEFTAPVDATTSLEILTRLFEH